MNIVYFKERLMKKNNCLTSIFFSLALCFVCDGAAFAEEDVVTGSVVKKDKKKKREAL